MRPADTVVDAVNDLVLQNRQLQARIEFLETQLPADHGAYVRVPRNPTRAMEMAVIHANRCGDPFIEIAKESWIAGLVWGTMMTAFLRESEIK